MSFTVDDVYETPEAVLNLGNYFFLVGQGYQMTVLTPGNILNGQYTLQTIHINNDRFCNGTKKLSFYLPDDNVDHAKNKYLGNYFKYGNTPSKALDGNNEMQVVSLSLVKSSSACTSIFALLFVLVVIGYVAIYKVKGCKKTSTDYLI